MVPQVSVGDRIRQARTARRLSLSEVASRADISIATLSRIERDKQGLDLGLFLILSSVLKAAPRDLIGDDAGDKVDPLAVRIASLNHGDRVQLWRDLAEQRRSDGRSAMRSKLRKLVDEVEELLAQLEFVQAEMESVRAGVRRRRIS